MNIILNGEPRQLANSLRLEDLITTLGYGGQRIAVERNGEMIPKSQYLETLLADGDRIEIVTAVAGG